MLALHDDAQMVVGREVECRSYGQLLKVRIPARGESRDETFASNGLKVLLQVVHLGAFTGFSCGSANGLASTPRSGQTEGLKLADVRVQRPAVA